MEEAYESQLRWCLVRRSLRVNWALHFYGFLSVKATGQEMGDERHNGVVSHRDLGEIVVRTLNDATTEGL